MTKTGSSSMFFSCSFKFGNLLLAVATLVLSAACGFFPETRSWTEDVQLDDGSVIAIERYVRFESSNSVAGDAFSAIETKASLSFTGELKDLPPWSVPLMPLVLFRDAQTQEWTIVATAGQCDVWYERGKPLPPYWEYRLIDGRWRSRPLSASAKGRATNLFFDYLSKSLPRRLTVKSTQALLSNSTMPEIYRRILPDVRRHCMVSAK